MTTKKTGYLTRVFSTRLVLLAACFAFGLQMPGIAAAETIVIRTGQVNGAPGSPGDQDDSFTNISTDAEEIPLRDNPFSASDFADARNGSRSLVIFPNTDSNWIAQLPSDRNARWIHSSHEPMSPTTRGSGRPAYTALHAFGFDIQTGGDPLAVLTLTWATDDRLGDPSGPNESGFYLNGTPLPVSGGTFSAPTTAKLVVQLRSGTNYLYAYQRDTAGATAGLMLSATVDVAPCSFGNVNSTVTDPVDVLFVNGSAGDACGELSIDSTNFLVAQMIKAPTPSPRFDNRYYLGIWGFRWDESTATRLPANLGLFCTRPLTTLSGYVSPLYAANTLRPTDSRLEPPSPEASGLDLDDAKLRGVVQVDRNTFPPGTELTLQGFIGDGNAPSSIRVATTNAVVVTVE